MIQLETYKGTRSRHTCPKCGKPREFTRFIDTATGNRLPDNVGVFNRVSKCGYKYTAKQYFADNPQPKTKNNQKPKASTPFSRPSRTAQKVLDYIPLESLLPTLANYGRNGFVKFVLNLFPEDHKAVELALRRYFVGTFDDYTCFPSIDRLNRICRAKLIRFNAETGKRLKGEYDTSSLPAKLKLKDFNYKQIFFGEHLLSQFTEKPVAIVEAEKTAIIASICMSEFVWLGCNSKQWLKVERLRKLGTKKIILYPDADGFEAWQKVAQEACKSGLDVSTSEVIESHATPEQKAQGYDLADYLIKQQAEINRYNAKLDAVLSDENLTEGLCRIFEERIYLAEECGNLSRAEAESVILDPFEIQYVVERI